MRHRVDGVGQVRPPQFPIHRRLDQLDGQRCRCEHGRRKGSRLSEQLLRRDHPVDQTVIQRLPGAQPTPGEGHLLGKRRPNPVVEANDRETGRQPDQRLGNAELRLIRRHDHVTRDRQLETPAEREPVHGGDDRLVQPLRDRQPRHDVGQEELRVFHILWHVREVSPRAERGAGTRDDHDAQIVASRELVEAATHPVPQLRRERVPALRVVHRGDPDGAITLPLHYWHVPSQASLCCSFLRDGAGPWRAPSGTWSSPGVPGHGRVPGKTPVDVSVQEILGGEPFDGELSDPALVDLASGVHGEVVGQDEVLRQLDLGDPLPQQELGEIG